MRRMSIVVPAGLLAPWGASAGAVSHDGGALVRLAAEEPRLAPGMTAADWRLLTGRMETLAKAALAIGRPEVDRALNDCLKEHQAKLGQRRTLASSAASGPFVRPRRLEAQALIACRRKRSFAG